MFSPHSSSNSDAIGTTWSACTVSIATPVRGFAAVGTTDVPSCRATRGPKTSMSTSVSCGRSSRPTANRFDRQQLGRSSSLQNRPPGLSIETARLVSQLRRNLATLAMTLPYALTTRTYRSVGITLGRELCVCNQLSRYPADPAVVRHEVQRRVLVQDGLHPILESGGRFHSQFIHEPSSNDVVLAQRVGLPSGAGEADHQHLGEPIAPRVEHGHLLQLADH